LRWSSKHFWQKTCKKSADLHPRQGKEHFNRDQQKPLFSKKVGDQLKTIRPFFQHAFST
jgi:hypothetical protein